MLYKRNCLFLLVFLGFWVFSFSASAQKQPNIIVIMADDLGYGDLGCYGQEVIKTPNIDALASGGMKFTNFYAGCTVCSPSRESLLTGMHTGHTYIRGNYLTDEQGDLTMPGNKITIAEIVKKVGYRTGLIGKWGLGGEGHGPETQGFDYSYGYLDQIKAHNYYPPYLYENGKRVILENNADGREGVYSHNLFVEKTMDFLNNSRSDQPFFLYLPYTLPHGGYTLPPDTPYAEKDWQKEFKVYATMISLLDRDIGRIVQLLNEKEIDDNTVILFTSDNGPNLNFANFFNSNGPFRAGKRALYDGGIREPLIAYWPGKIKPGQVSHHITAAWDLLPTLCQITGVQPPSQVDGISFLPELMGQDQTGHEFLYLEYYEYNWNWKKPENELPRNWLESRAIRMGKWKAVKNNIYKDKNATIELYDIENDLGEEHNIAAEHPDIIKKVKEIFATCCTASPYFPYQ